jgi:5'-nucleotidase
MMKFLGMLCSLGLLATAQGALAGAPQTLTVIATTDFHGALLPELLPTGSGERVPVGGAALLSSYINVIRARAAGPSILVDAGDLFQGSMESNLAEGAPVVRVYNYLKVAAAAVGNHEFDFGPVGEHSVPISPGDDPQGALKARAAEAHFPFLAANVVDDSGASPAWLRKSVVYDLPGVRVGVVGASTPDTPNTTVRQNRAGLRFLEPAGPVEAEARRLRTEAHVNVVILAFHGGGNCKDNGLSRQDDLSSCERDGEMFRLLRALPSGLIDVAVGGHTHQGMAKRIGHTLVLQAYSHGKQVGWAELPLTPTAPPARSRRNISPSRSQLERSSWRERPLSLQLPPP